MEILKYMCIFDIFHHLFSLIILYSCFKLFILSHLSVTRLSLFHVFLMIFLYSFLKYSFYLTFIQILHPDFAKI